MVDSTKAQMETAFAKAMEDFFTPVAEHKILAQRMGRWRQAAKFWMDPDAPPSELYGEATYRMIMEGRYLHCEYWLDFNGVPVEGLGLIAFDRVSGQYQSVWINNSSTGLMSSGMGVRRGTTTRGASPV